MSCSKCRVPIGLGTAYYQWGCGHVMPEGCYGAQIFTEMGAKCPTCSQMMTRTVYESWCLQGFVQYYVARSGFQYASHSTAPILPQFQTSAPLHDLSRFAPLHPFQVTDTAAQCVLSSRKTSNRSTPKLFYSQHCTKRNLAKKD